MSAKRTIFSPLKNEQGRTLLETVIIAFFVLLLLLMAVDRFTGSITIVRESALRIELSNIRSGVNLFAMTKRRLPNSIHELVAGHVVVNKQSIDGTDYKIEMVGKYVESMTTDSDGVPLDPFGNVYTLEPETGRVHTTTDGYEHW